MATRKQTQKTWEELEDYRNELLVGNAESPATKTKIAALEGKLVELKDQTTEKVAQILEMHKSVFDDGEQKSIKVRLETFVDDSKQLFEDTKEKQEEFDGFYTKVFGEESANGEIIGGLKTELENYTTKYENLYDKIESLLPGATSAGLAKVFEDKVKEYSEAANKWTNWFLAVVSILSLYYGVYLWLKPVSDSFTGSFLNLFHKTPFLIFAVWLLV